MIRPRWSQPRRRQKKALGLTIHRTRLQLPKSILQNLLSKLVSCTLYQVRPSWPLIVANQIFECHCFNKFYEFVSFLCGLISIHTLAPVWCWISRKIDANPASISVRFIDLDALLEVPYQKGLIIHPVIHMPIHG